MNIKDIIIKYICHHKCISIKNKKCIYKQIHFICLFYLNKIKRLLNTIKYYLFYSWWNILTDLKYKVPNYFERAYYGVGHADVWDFDCYLTSVIIRGLKQLKKYKHGFPIEICEKYKNQSLAPGVIDLLAEKEWNEILDKIIYGFECTKLILNDYGELNNETRMIYEQSRQEGFDLFKEYYFDLWD